MTAINFILIWGMNNVTEEDIIKQALMEDCPGGDAASDPLFKDETTSARLIAKENGILSGLSVFKKTFQTVDPDVTVKTNKQDGDMVKKGETAAIVNGKILSILRGERIALNFLQRMSGVATLTQSFVRETKGTKASIYDTRKTTPLLRALEKKAVRDGGGHNHRMNLSELAMLKDNHLRSSKSIKEAVNRVRTVIGNEKKIEVEVETIAAFKEAMATTCDIIMLDNMSLVDMKTCVDLNTEKKILEASGNMTIDRISKVAATGVDMISVGILTHSYKALDLSLKF